jgi:hypothetical protein
LGDLAGEAAVYQALAWKEGAFNLEAEVNPPSRSIERSYTALLFEGARRIDEGEAQLDRELQAVLGNPGDGRLGVQSESADTVGSLTKIEVVEGAVLVAERWSVTRRGRCEKEAVAAFVNAAGPGFDGRRVRAPPSGLPGTCWW